MDRRPPTGTPHPAGGASLRDALAAAGSVGHDLLEVDWSATPLGAVESWSPSLRSAVRIMLTSKFAMWMAWGPELTFMCNDAYRRDTLGTKYPWALGRPADEVWSEIWADIGPRIDRVISTGEATWDESLMLLLERSGYVEETYHTFSYSPLAEDDGSVTGMLCVVAEVTEQVIAERRMHTLRDLGVRMSTAQDEGSAVLAACAHLESNPSSLPFVAVYLFDDDASTARLAGASGVPHGHPAFPATLDADADADGTSWPTGQARDNRSVVVGDLQDRFDDLPTGAWDRPPHQALVVPITAPSGRLPYGMLVAGANPYCLMDDAYRDFVDLVAAHIGTAVTDARALQDQRERAERLAALDQAKSDFLANVSHELRTPLTLLLGPAEDALADGAAVLDGRQRSRVELVVRNGTRMLQLVNSLLEFSRLQAGEDDAVFVPTDLGGYTAELASMFESAAERAGLALDVHGEVDLEVHVDREHWAKIVVNLLSNAFKFTFEGGVAVEVRAHDGAAVLSVRDTGTGIPEDELPLLFERFHRVSRARSRSHEGSGIGLALVEQLVRAHGGRVGVTSTPEVGTTVTVALPLGHQHLPPDRVAASTSDLAGPRPGHDRRVATEISTWDLEPRTGPASVVGGDGADDPVPARPATGARILVVDDNPDMRVYIGDLLRDHGYAVRTAGDGLAALEALRTEGADLVLTDVLMPRLDGFGLLQRLRADPALAVTPVVMLSARAGEEGTLQGLEAGADDYLAKPFSARELLARVSTHLALDHAEQVRDALQRSRDLLDQAQRLAAVGSWEVDLDTDTVTGSDTFVDLVGMDHDDLRGLGAAGVLTRGVHPDDLERVTSALADLEVGDTLAYETRVVRPDGEERLFAVRGERQHGRVVRGSAQDITEQRRLQDQLVAAEALEHTTARERAIAAELQRSLLPVLPDDVEALEVATYYQAAGESAQVGGDWYDMVDLGAGRVALVIGDVMGRGVRAAATTGQLRAAVRALLRIDLTPTEVLEHLDGIVQEMAPEQIVTCVLAVVDVNDLHLTYASAGHPPVVLTRGAESRLLPRTGPPLGAGYYGAEGVRVRVRPGDVLALYTDGLVERRGSDLVADIDRLAAELRGVAAAPVDEQVAHVVEAALERGSGGDDDVALVVARVRPPLEGSVLRVRLDHHPRSAAAARSALDQHMDGCGVPAGVRDDALVAVSELVTNAVLHARAPVSLRLRCSERTMLVEVLDRTLLRPKRQRPADDDEHGRGLNIVAALASTWGTHRSAAGKAVWCTFDW